MRFWNDDREVIAVLHDVGIARFIGAAEVHVVGERGAGDPGDLDPQREGFGLGLSRSDLQHPVTRGVGDVQEGDAKIAHLHHDTTDAQSPPARTDRYLPRP